MFSIFRRHSPASTPPESPPRRAGPSPALGSMGPGDLRQRASPISSRPRFREDEQTHAQAAMRPRQPSPMRPSTSAVAAPEVTPAQAQAAAALAFRHEVEQWRQDAERRAPQVNTGFNYGSGYEGKLDAVNQVAAAIAAAAAERAPRLEIHMLPATDLPQAIGQMSHLRHLSVKATECQRLPDSIGNLAGLRELVLANNQAMTRLPESLTHIGRLETLVVHLTPLRTLPLHLGMLSRLTTLSLSGGTYEALPPGFTDLSRLQNLEISRSRPERREQARPGATPDSLRKGLKTLPADFNKLQSLRHLTLSDHAEFAQVPASLYELPRLRELTLSKCPKLMALPPTGPQPLRHLVKLDLSGNTGLTALPQGFGQLPLLEDLNLKGNSGLIRLPAVTGLAKLHTLNLEGCRNLSALPQGLGGLATLRELNLRHCHQLPVHELEAVLAMLPRECQVTMPGGESRTGGPRPVLPPRAQPAARMPAFFDAPRRADPAYVSAWKARLAPFSADDPNGRLGQWMTAASRRGMTADDRARMDRIVDTAATSTAFRARAIDFATQNLMLERDEMGMTLGAVPPRTFSTVRDMHDLLVEHVLSEQGGLDAARARELLAGALRERYPQGLAGRPPAELVGTPPARAAGRGMHVGPPWPPLAAYVRTHDPQGRSIIAKAQAKMDKLHEDVGLQLDADVQTGEAAASSSAARGPKAKPAKAPPAINEGEYRDRSNALMQARDRALHERYVALAAELLNPSRAHPGGRRRH